jgi:hypothetical protein
VASGSVVNNARTVLVTGIHREELSFGDQVAELLASETIDVLRIPEGVPQSCSDVDQQFYHEARQRELYLQLYQQVKRRYELLIDLHSGWDDDGPCADIYCHDPGTLQSLGRSLDSPFFDERVRLIQITGSGESPSRAERVDCEARTSIPDVVWRTPSPLYVGLELYLPDRQSPNEATSLAQALIKKIRGCVLRASS